VNIKITKEEIIKRLNQVRTKKCQEVSITFKAFDAYNSIDINGDSFCYFEDFEKIYYQLYIEKIEEANNELMNRRNNVDHNKTIQIPDNNCMECIFCLNMMFNSGHCDYYKKEVDIYRGNEANAKKPDWCKLHHVDVWRTT